MCLDKLVKFDPGTTGWKILRKTTEGFFTPQILFRCKPHRIGKRFETAKTILLYANRSPYLSGFHIFVNRKDATSWRNDMFKKIHRPLYRVYKVAFDGVSTTGIQDGFLVVVARRMKLW
jgi:hypothetical protein